MLPRNLHLEQINRFHDTLKSIEEQIENETDVDKQFNPLMKFHKLHKIWFEIDDAIENLKDKLDQLDSL